jgi:nucleotide-binding universal stress UspA family protein
VRRGCRYELALSVDESSDAVGKQIDAVRALPHAAESVHVTVLHVFEDNPSGASATQVSSVRRAVDGLEEAGIDHDIDEESGEPATVIQETAEQVDADTVCIGGRKRSPTGKVLFGSVTQAVILGADRPVLVVGSDDR